MITQQLAQQLQDTSSTFGYVEFYVLDLTRLGGGIHRFTPHAVAPAGVTWRGETYIPMPISTSGWDISGTGALPRPMLKISNVHRLLLAEVIGLGDLVGGKLTRYRTFENYVDGNVNADPNAFLPPDKFLIEQLVEHTPTELTWQMTSVLDRFGMQLPRRQVLKDAGFPGVGRLR
ncbi:phage minor tail protein L [Acidovorax sp.]|uniref:phage minor tail protein L n=1 Tax=Acidovorax sp. TaxID=1872122 RepID=UPI00391F536F